MWKTAFKKFGSILEFFVPYVLPLLLLVHRSDATGKYDQIHYDDSIIQSLEYMDSGEFVFTTNKMEVGMF